MNNIGFNRTDVRPIWEEQDGTRVTDRMPTVGTGGFTYAHDRDVHGNPGHGTFLWTVVTPGIKRFNFLSTAADGNSVLGPIVYTCYQVGTVLVATWLSLGLVWYWPVLG